MQLNSFCPFFSQLGQYQPMQTNTSKNTIDKLGGAINATESILPFLLTINKLTTVDGQQFKEYDARKYTLLAPPQCQHIAYCKC